MFFNSTIFQFCPHDHFKWCNCKLRFSAADCQSETLFSHGTTDQASEWAHTPQLHVVHTLWTEWKTESRLVYFISFQYTLCLAVVVVAVHRFKWPQFEHNHILITYLHSFFLSFIYSFFVCVYILSYSRACTHTHTPHTHFETCSYAVSSRPICFYVHVSHKTVSNMGRMKRVRGSEGESEKKQYLKPDFFLTNLLSLGLSWNVYVYSGHTYTYTHIHICVGKCIYICFCEQQRKIVIYSTYFY